MPVDFNFTTFTNRPIEINRAFNNIGVLVNFTRFVMIIGSLCLIITSFTQCWQGKNYKTI